MCSGIRASLKAPMLGAALALFAAASLQADTTVTFQNGAGGYSGAKDASINTQYADSNGGNGIRWSGDPELGCYNVSGSGGYSVKYILKFGGLTVPAGSQVVSASLALSFDYWDATGGNITGFYLKNSWDPASSRLGWLHRDATHNWAGPGASTAGVDTVAGLSFRVPTLRPVGSQTVTIPLDATQVQSWIDSPAANQGIILVNNNNDDIVRPISTTGTARMRPKLMIVLASPAGVSVSVTPPSVTMLPGAQQTFSATVTGSSNTAVTWTATGGTITSAGVYTAGAAAGTFAVTATSVADPSRSGSASVTIQPVQIQINPTTATMQPGQTKQFTATVTGTSNTAVTWTATGGMISNTGLFTAASTPGAFTVTATSIADTTKSSTAQITIPAPAVSVLVTPNSATVQIAQTQQFSATVTGTSNTAVTWTATGGTISNTGLFTAGSTPGAFTVTATSVADTSKFSTAQITIPAPAVSVSVTPNSATVQIGQTQQFTATVTGTSNTAVTWTATGGTISNTGLFTAGSTPGAFTVTATSVADTTKFSTAQITIPAPAVSVLVTPNSATVQIGQTQQFSATVTGSSNTAVTWTATGGTISNTGLFTAGSTSGAFTVTATSVADTTKSSAAQVTIPTPTVSVSVNPTSATVQPVQTKQFTATVTGTANTAVTWTATGGTISSTGLYTAGANTGSFTATATSVADTSKSATASVTIGSSPTLPGLPPIPRQSDGPYVVIQSPVTGMHFTAPGTIRIYADPSDSNAPDPDALTVDFLLNGQQVGTFTGSGAANGYFAFTATNLVAGVYTITTRLHTTGGGTVTSAPVVVFVDNPAPSSGPVFNLTSDVVLSGSQTMTYAGTAANHCTINGNGFQIRSNGTFTGSLNISYCDIRNLGTATNPAIDVTVSGTGSVQLTGNVLELFGTVSIGSNDQAQVAVRNNEFRENTLVPVTSLPTEYPSQTLPVFFATGNSSAQKFFQGNNVGLSTVKFDSTQNWLIGGSTDAESNVMIGVRCGFTVINPSAGMVLRGNYSQHNYPHRFSQGNNFELDGDGFLVEHNIIRSSSWPVRGMGGELRYNLIDASGNSDAIIRGISSGTNVHHNIVSFTVSQTFYEPGTGLDLLYNVDNIQFHNNTLDGGGLTMLFSGVPVTVGQGSLIGSLRNNVFYNFASQVDSPVLSGSLGESTNPPLARLRYADYNDFYNPNAANQTNYGLGVVGIAPGAAGYAMHDLGGLNGHVNPKFTQPTALPFPFLPQDIWSRAKRVSDVLATYRAMYTPAAGSPLIGAGDPQDGAGGNIGAVGNGEATDQFGKFGNGVATPPAPVIASFTASSGTVQAGQSVTLNWSVTGANTISIAPGVGTVTGNSITVTPSATTTYTLTATNGGGFTTATTTVSVNAGTPISVAVAPTSTSIAINTTRQFTATVTGTSNTAVTWTATGGTISNTGVYTAGAATGSFTVTATSVADSTKSASATVTITPPQPVGITVAPSPVTVFTGGTQQFTATVTNAANPAVTWTATGGTILSTGLYTAGATAGSFTVTATSVQDPSKSAAATVTLVVPTTTGRPRIILDAPTLAALRSRAQAHTAEWTRLKAFCDQFTGGGSVLFIGENGYPNPPNVGEGYQGSGYIDALMPLGLCYQTTLLSDPATAAQYGAKAVAILMAMSDPAHQTADGVTPVWDRDDGYGMRNFGVAMGIGYDWFHELLDASQRTQLQTALNNWINGFENDAPDNFEYVHPQGNYFAGYYAAKCMAALAVQGDSPLGDTWWNDWYNHQHLQRVAPYYTANLTGGGWLEGFAQYGILSSRNQSLPALAVKTAKGIDIIHGSQPYTFPLDQARYLMHFTWPSRDIIDDRGELYSTGDPTYWPGTGSVDIYRFYAGFLAMWGDPAAPMMHKYARDAKTALDAIHFGDTTEWIDFLFWDPTAPEASDYSSLPLSYLAPGIGEVGARSDWSNSATFMSFLSGPYVNNPGAGHEAFEKGSPAIDRNRNPLLVNPNAWLSHEPNGDPGWSATYDDRFGNWDVDHRLGNRTLYNTFQVRHLDATGNILDNYGQWAMGRDDGSRTKIGRYEDGGSYVLSVGQFLEDMYRPFQTICPGVPPVTSWSREVVYLRPSQFVIYDRTGICNSSLDQYLAFHFPANPVEVTGGAAGTRRFDINPGLFAGAMTTILPASPSLTITDHVAPDPATWNKMWRIEERAPGAKTTGHVWMNVFDAAPTSSQVAAASAVNITAGPAVGALLQSSTGNSVVIAGTAAFGTAISGPLGYVVPAAQTRHVVTDLTPSTGYTITVSVGGGNHTVSITPGGSSMTTANGALTFQVSAGGQVSQ
jgi:hypothetical protein